MKMIKRTFAILLTLIMLASMVVMPVNAAQEFSFTMTNCKKGFVYTVYKLATYNPNTGAYSDILKGMETIITEFTEGTAKIYNEKVLEACNNLSVEVLEGRVAYTVVSNDLTDGTYTQVCQPGVYFVKATSGPTTGYVEVNNSVFQLPYYEVDQDANTSVQINTITFSAGAKVFDKSQDVVKEITNSDVKDRTDISTAKIGDVVQYRITGSILGSSDQHLKYYALADTMDDSLTFVNNGESVTLPTQATTSEEDTTAPSDDETTADETSPSSDETDSDETDPDETSDSSSKESEETTSQDEDAVSYALVGYINGKNVDVEEDQSLAQYPFKDGTLTVNIESNSYVHIKTADGTVNYMFDNYTTATSGVLRNTSTGANEKMYVPAGEVTFTLTDNGDGTLTLSYVESEPTSESTTESTTVEEEEKQFALVGYINGANVDVEDDQTLAEYPFEDGTLTVDFERDIYVHVRTTDGDTNGIYYFDEYVKEPTGTLYNSSTGANEKMKVPAGKVTFNLTENEGGTLTLSYTVEAVETETTTQETTATEATTAETSATTLYFTPSSDWASAGARFAAYVFNSAGDSAWASLTDADGDGVYECTLPSGYTWESVIFCRMDPSNTTNDWIPGIMWNQTADLTIPSDSNHFTVNDGEWDKATGTWSVYTPVEDSTDDTTEDQYPSKTVYFLPGSEWEKDDAWFAAYIYGSGGEAWVEFTDEDGDGYYKAVTPANIGDNIIFVRMDPAKTIEDSWNGKWNQSSSESYIEKIDAGTNCFKITDPWNDSNTGEWIEYTPNITVYLNPDTANTDNDWTLEGARFAAYFWNDEENAWFDLTDEDGDGVYQVTVPEGQYENVIFCRMNPETTENSWDNKWDQTNDQMSFEDNISAGNNCFYISDPWNTSSTGYWTSYTPASIAGVSMLTDLDDSTYSTVYFVNYEGWEKVYAYAYNSETDYAASWPGVAMTATQTTVLNGSLIYKFTVSDNYSNIIFNDGEDNQTADLEIMAGQYYDIYSEQWYESISDIPEAEYTLVGYINGENVGCEDDYQGTGYEFSNGKVTVQLDQSSWVYVKTQNNKYYYMFETYCEYSSGDIALGNTEKMYVPEGNVTFTLVENGNGTLTLSYPGSNVQEEEETDLYQGTEETTVETDADTYSVSSYAISSMSDDYGIATASDTNTVYFINSGNWSTVNAYYWTGSSGPVSWPGVAMTNTGATAPNGATIYSISVPSTYDMIIFNNNSSQTADLTLQAGQYYDYETEKWYDSADNIPTSGSALSFYLVASGAAANFTNVYAHVWNTAGASTTWPGKKMTDTGETTSEGYKVFKVSFNTADYTSVIFNDNHGTQSSEATIQNGKYYDYSSGIWYDSLEDIGKIAGEFYLVGGLNEWTPTDEYKFTSNDDGTSNLYLTINLEAGEYKFKIQNGSNMYGYDGYVINSDQTVTLSTYAGNATLKPPVSGEITLTFNKENAQLTVDMPEVEVDPESMVDVYYTNFDNWDDVWVYNYDYDTDTSPVQWPGTKMEVLTDGNGDPVLCNNGATIYHAQISNQYSTVIFNNNAGTESKRMKMVENGYYDKWSGQWYTSMEDIPAKEYYLVGTIDGKEYTEAYYKFSNDGVLTLETSQNSYVYVKNKFDTYIYKFPVYTETTSGVLSTGYSVSGHPMVIPAGVATINLTENSNGSLTLSYSVGLPNIVVRLDDDVLLTEGVHYKIVKNYKFDTEGKKNATFAIVLTEAVLNETQEVAPGKTIYDFNEISVDYMAILNQKAEIGEPGNKNLVTLDYTRTSSLDADDTNETPSPEEKDPNNPTGVNEVDGNVTTVYTFELVINKIDAGKLSPLEGAEFKLYTDAGATNAVVVNGKEQVATSNANGVLSFVGLGSGTYYLKETKAPFMYLVNNTVYKFVIKADAPIGQLATQTSNGVEFVFDNDGTFETTITNLYALLPITGATGIAMVILGGLMLVFISLVLYKSKKKKVSKA